MVESDEKLHSAHNLKNLGNQAYKHRDYASAIAQYSKALESLHGLVEQENVKALRVVLLTNLSTAYHYNGDYTNALKSAKDALTHEPTSLKAHYRAGLAALLLSDAQTALGHLETLQIACKEQPMQNQSSYIRAVDVYIPYTKALLDHQRLVVGYLGEEFQPTNGCHYHPDSSTDLLENNKGCLTVNQLIKLLEDDIEGEADVDSLQVLNHLATYLETTDNNTARALFETKSGYSLLFFYMTEGYCNAAIKVLKACATEHVLWPSFVWQKLMSLLVLDSHGGQPPCIVESVLELIVWAVSKEAWVRQQLMVLPLSSDPEIVPLKTLLQAFGLCDDERHCATADQQRQLTPIAAMYIAQLLGLYANDTVSLQQLHCQPLGLLLTLVQNAEDIVENYNEKQSSNIELNTTTTTTHAALSDSEYAALQQLKAKRNALFNPQVVSLQKQALHSLVLLTQSYDVVLAESVIQKRVDTTPSTSSSINNTTKLTAGPFIPKLLSLVKALHEQSPKRTAPIVGADGNTVTYSKRPYAAEFKDNPAGDFLLSLDLEEDTGNSISDHTKNVADANGQFSQASIFTKCTSEQQQKTVLELALQVAYNIAQHGNHMVVILQRQNIVELCESFCNYLTPSVVETAEKILCAVCERHQPTLQEVLETGEISSLIALVKHSSSSSHSSITTKATDALIRMVDSCSGEDFARLTAADGALLTTFNIICTTAADNCNLKERELKNAALRLLQLCLDRSQRAQHLPISALPSRGVWDQIDRSALKKVLGSQSSSSFNSKKKGGSGKEGDKNEGLDNLKKGFFSKNIGTSSKAIQSNDTKVDVDDINDTTSSPTSTSSVEQHARKKATVEVDIIHTTKYSNGAVIEEIQQQEESGQSTARHLQTIATTTANVRNEQDKKSHPPFKDAYCNKPLQTVPEQPDVLSVQQEEEEEEEDIPDLHDVFDSSNINTTLRQSRNKWVSIPLKDKLRWTQTSSDVSIYLTLPANTKARELSINVTPIHLTVTLQWYGTIISSPFHGKVKPSEVHWCLESDDEVHVLLPKADTRWWKTALEGGPTDEKGYYELLQDAVNADEPVTPYDEMTEESKDLLDSILERQAYINQGWIDPEGFDDFRVVIGENSLGGDGGGR